MAVPGPGVLRGRVDTLEGRANLTDTAQANPTLVNTPQLKLDEEQARELGNDLPGLRDQLPHYASPPETWGQWFSRQGQTLKGAFTGKSPNANLVLQFGWSVISNVLLSSSIGASVTTGLAVAGIVVLGAPILRKSLKEFNKVFREATGVEPELVAKEWFGKQFAKLGIPVAAAGAVFAAAIYYYYKINLGYDQLALTQNLNGIEVTKLALKDFQVWLSAAVLPGGSALTEMCSRFGINKKLAEFSVPVRYRARTATEENLKDDLLELASFEDDNLKEKLESATPEGVTQQMNATKALIQKLAAQASMNIKDREALLNVQQAKVKRLEISEKQAQILLNNKTREHEYLSERLELKANALQAKELLVAGLERQREALDIEQRGPIELQLQAERQQRLTLQQEHDALSAAVEAAEQAQDQARTALEAANRNLIDARTELGKRRRALHDASADGNRIRNQVRGLSRYLNSYLGELTTERNELRAIQHPTPVQSNRLEILRAKIAELEGIRTLENTRIAAIADPREGLGLAYESELHELTATRTKAQQEEARLVARFTLLSGPAVIPGLTPGARNAEINELRDELIPRQQMLRLEYQRRVHALKKERQTILREHLRLIGEADRQLRGLGALPAAVPVIATQQLVGVIAGEQAGLTADITAYQNGPLNQNQEQRQLLHDTGVLHHDVQALENGTGVSIAARTGEFQADLEANLQAKIAALQTEIDNLQNGALLGNVRTSQELDTIQNDHLNRLQALLNGLPLDKLSPVKQNLLNNGTAIPPAHTGFTVMQTCLQRQRTLLAKRAELAPFRNEQADLMHTAALGDLNEQQLNRLQKIQAEVVRIRGELNAINVPPAMPGLVNAAILADIQAATDLTQAPLLLAPVAQQLQELPHLGPIRKELNELEQALLVWPCNNTGNGQLIDQRIQAVDLNLIQHLPVAIRTPLLQKRADLDTLRQTHVRLRAFGERLDALRPVGVNLEQRAAAIRTLGQDLAHLLPASARFPHALRVEYNRLVEETRGLLPPPKDVVRFHIQT